MFTRYKSGNCMQCDSCCIYNKCGTYLVQQRVKRKFYFESANILIFKFYNE